MKSKTPKFEYRTTFDLSIAACEIQDGFLVSKSNIQNLKSLIPSEVDLENNIDLMGVAFNAAVVNEFNKNGDGISTKTALESIKQFIHKPTNIEHDKKKIVGHIVKAGFSSYENSEILEEIDPNETDPFNIALGAVVYKTVDKDFFDLLNNSTNPKSNIYNTISASWEIGFNDYMIAVGSRNLKEAEIISDPQRIQEMRPMLRGFGGKGFTDDGKEVYRLIVGKVYPLGIGFTMKPAANVKGVISLQEDSEIEEKGDAAVLIKIEKKENVELQKIAAKISQNLKKTVNNTNIMELETLLSELKESLVEKKFSQEAIAGMTSTFAEAIKQKDEEYKASLNAAEKERAEIAKANEELKNSVESIKEELKAAQKRIEEFESLKKQEEAVARFNERMEEIDSLYDLEESDASFIAEKLKNLDSSEEAFASLKKELEVFWSTKNKAKKAEIESQIQARIEEEVQKRLQTSEASEKEDKEEDVEEALASAEQTTSEIPNNNEVQASETKSFRDRFASAFSRENVLK